MRNFECSLSRFINICYVKVVFVHNYSLHFHCLGAPRWIIALTELAVCNLLLFLLFFWLLLLFGVLRESCRQSEPVWKIVIALMYILFIHWIALYLVHSLDCLCFYIASVSLIEVLTVFIWPTFNGSHTEGQKKHLLDDNMHLYCRGIKLHDLIWIMWNDRDVYRTYACTYMYIFVYIFLF